MDTKIDDIRFSRHRISRYHRSSIYYKCTNNIPNNSSRLNNAILPFQDSKLSSEINKLYTDNNIISESKKQIKQKLIKNLENTVHELQRKCKSNTIDYDMQCWKSFKYSSNNFAKKWNMFIFGSEACDIRTQNSDIDIAIQLPMETNKFNKINLLKGLSTILDDTKQKYSILDYYGTTQPFKNASVTQILKAEYPIIKIKTDEGNLFDISIADEFCLKRKQIITNIVKYYDETLNVPIKELIVFVKYWSKQRGINNSYKQYLNSFGYTVLVIKFLEYICIMPRHNNNLSFLVYEFFTFYAKVYDAKTHSIRINSCSYYKTFDNRIRNKYFDKFPMEIIDPANIDHNIAKNVGHNQYTRIKQEFHRSYQICRSHKPSNRSKSLFDRLTDKYIMKSKIKNVLKKNSHRNLRKRKRDDNNDCYNRYQPPSHKKRRIY